MTALSIIVWVASAASTGWMECTPLLVREQRLLSIHPADAVLLG